MKKKQILFICVVGTLILINIGYCCYDIYDIFRVGSRISPFITLPRNWSLFVSILAFMGLFLRKPIGYLMFMIFPFYMVMDTFVFYFRSSFGGFNFERFLLFGILFSIMFNLNFIRRLYIDKTRELLSHLLLAFFIAFFGAFQRFIM